MILNDKVYLGDTLLDLGEANGVTLEYSISDPADMAAIFTPGSWTVNLPKSAVNLQAFGFMTEPGSTTDAPHKEHPCMVIRNGVPLFDSGKLTVIDVTDTINVVITWNTNERLTELSGRKLRDLAITKVMRWDPATFEASEDNDFKWVAETGYKQAGRDGIMNYNARGFRPAVKASYLLAALLPGLTIGQTYWNRLENVWLMLPTTNGNEAIDAALTYRGYGAYSNYDPVLNVRDVMRNFKEYGTIAATYDLLINQSSPSNPFSGLYIPKDGRYRIFGHIRTSSSAGGSELYNGKFRLMLNLSYDRDENGALVENYENLYYSEYPINSNNVFDVTVDLQAGDVVTIFNSYQLTNATISGDIAIDLNEVATENTDTGYLLDYPIRENLPDVGCIEFITALFSMVALQAQTSGTAVKVFSIDDVINSNEAIDISPYINDRNGRQLEYSHGLTADNVLSYVDETDAIHFAANTYNKTINKVVELPFASGRDMTLYRRDEDGRFEFVGEDTAMALSRSGTASIRVINDHINDSMTRTVTVSVFGFGGLDWAALYGTYWQGYKGVFADNQRVVKYNAVVPESFVRTLDFSKPVHDGVNRYLLMRVSDYAYTGACTLMMALLDGVEVSGGPLENVILADVAVPLLFDVNVEALYNPSLVGTGKLIRELEEYTGDITPEISVPVDLGEGPARKRRLKDLVGQIFDILKTSDVDEETDDNVYSALRTIQEIEERAISKTKEDSAKEKITFERGLQIGPEFVPGITGMGGNVDEKGNAVLESLTLRKFLEVPELRYNRVDVNVGDKWRAPGGGLIESVDPVAQVVTLKLEDGEIGAVALDDICMGIFHFETGNASADLDDSKGNRAFAGFSTCYFRITEIIEAGDNRRFRYALRPVDGIYPTQVHPMPGMHFVSYGNFTNANRQTSCYETRTYQRYLTGVSGWEYSVNNIAAQFGDLANLSIHGLQMEGYSAYLNNIYMSGTIQQFELLQPLRMEISSSMGDMLAEGESTVIDVEVYKGWVNLTADVQSWVWTRDSGSAADDLVWNQAHAGLASQATLSYEDLGAAVDTNVSCLFHITATIKEETIQATITL